MLPVRKRSFWKHCKKRYTQSCIIWTNLCNPRIHDLYINRDCGRHEIRMCNVNIFFSMHKAYGLFTVGWLMVYNLTNGDVEHGQAECANWCDGIVSRALLIALHCRFYTGEVPRPGNLPLVSEPLACWEFNEIDTNLDAQLKKINITHCNIAAMFSQFNL